MLQHTEWKTLLDALLPNTDYELTIDRDTLQLKTDPATATLIKTQLDQILQTPATFMKAAPYVFKDSHTGLNDPIYNEPVQPFEQTLTGAKNQLLRMFGKELAPRTGVSIELLFSEDAYFADGILYSMQAADKEAANYWHSKLKEALKRLHNISLDTIRKSWNGLGELPKTKDDSIKNAALADGTILPCLRLQNDRICVDLLRIYQLIASPKVEIRVDASKPNEAVVQIPTKHFFSYVQSCTKGVMFRVYKNHQDAQEARAQLIVLDRAPAIPSIPDYTFLLDRSSSIGEEAFAQLKERFIGYLRKLKDVSPNAKVRIVFFSNQTDKPLCYDLSKTDVDQIERDIRGVGCGGSTRLHCTMLAELERHLNSPDSKNTNNIIVTFTDGADNVAPEGALDPLPVEKITEMTNRFDGTSLPQMVMLGLGESYNAEVLGKLANATGSPFHHMNDINDLSRIFGTSLNNQGRTLKDVVVKILEQQAYERVLLQGRIPQSQASAPQLPDVVIPFRPNTVATLNLATDSYVVTVPDLARVSVINSTDRLRELGQEARALVADRAKQKSEVILRLDDIHREITIIKTTPEGAAFKADLAVEVFGYKNDLEKASINDALARSVASRANYQGSFFPTANAQPRPAYSPASHTRDYSYIQPGF
jgi:hypothetical protein